MTSRIRLLAALLLVALALAPLGAPSHAEPAPAPAEPAAPAARGKAVTVTPAQPMAGERTRFSGKVAGRAGTAVLERKKGKRWVAVARGKVRKGGKYRVAAPVKKAGTYRVRAGSFTSKKAKVRLAPQAAQISVTAPLVTGIARPVVATVTPARAGRTVRLQRLDGGTWTTVATATTDGAGQALIPYAAGPAGSTSYRILGERHRKSATVASAPQVVRTAPATELLSRGTAAGDTSHDPSVSADGRWVAFTSQSRLLPSDTDDREDIYLFDRVTGALTHLLPDAGGLAINPRLSANGRFLAFQSTSASFAGEADGDHDVFVLDRVTGVVDLVSQTPDGEAANRPSQLYAMSDDGRFVAFTSTASDLVGVLQPPNTDVRHAYLHDRTTGTNRALDRIGLGWATANIYGLDVSADGSRVAFSSGDDGLDPGHVDVVAVFGWDVAADGTISNRTNLTPDIRADQPSLSGDGSVLAFTTVAALGPGDLNGARDTYLRTPAGTFVFAGPYGAAGNPGGEISADGRFVSLSTKNVLPGDTNGSTADVAVWERATGTTTLITRAGAGASGDEGLSADGSVLVFGSAAPVVPGATGDYNVYVTALR
ncbi:TolB family protein [Nocardioides humi]|uniref:WD40-like Beta Propeller Repeat n=1 Tax=Nocardioides humi TaxID=449461 RepID=A0ABN2BSR4_9ACTN|nr:PD40 domain-containing protein [Nocardioides humi]